VQMAYTAAAHAPAKRGANGAAPGMARDIVFGEAAERGIIGLKVRIPAYHHRAGRVWREPGSRVNSWRTRRNVV
jgi:hypothetical protein